MTTNKSASMERLIRNRINKRLKNIETLERNQQYYAMIAKLYDDKRIPAAFACIIDKRSHCITIRFIGMSVQWYAHKEQVFIQDGNDKATKGFMLATELFHRLTLGRNAFAQLSLPKA